ncbi:hypothetical protein ABZ614_45255 [Streptomyces sp. NPDC013178]|uniref:hypothetical protein n=1 Tax=Streptomyces sp. NPDC013178 TaxID=3155118 RepID=UPI0033F20660
MSDDSVELPVQSLGDHEYLLLVKGDTATTELRFRASSSVLDALGTDSADEQLVVRQTATFLLEHQQVMDLPSMIDLEDVAAAYDGYLDELRQRLTSS